jgi:hypothetical protein
MGLAVDVPPTIPPPSPFSRSATSSFPTPPPPNSSLFLFGFEEAAPPFAGAVFEGAWGAGDGGGSGGFPFGRGPAPPPAFSPALLSHCSLESSEQGGRRGEGTGEGDRLEFRGRDIR